MTSNTFLDTHAVSWSAYKYYSVRLKTPESWTRLSRLDVKWFPSGTILILNSVGSRLIWPQTPRSVLDLISGRRSRPSLPVILAPFGMTAELDPALKQYTPCTVDTVLGDHDVEGDMTALAKTKREWFESLVSMLQYYGVSVPKDMQWVPVKVPLRYKHGSSEDSISESSEMALWPASLCLISDIDVLEEEDDNSWAWDNEDSKADDPLASAEAWYLGKDARQELLETMRKENELKVEADKSPISEDGEHLRNELPNSQKFLDAQTASGIYPTPPDGQPFHAGTLATTGESESTRPAEDINVVNSHNAAEEGTVHLDSTTANLPRFDSQHVDPDGMDEDYLFGGMNSGMFTATGLTEDDFNFFDERDDVLKTSSSPDPMSSLTVENPNVADVQKLSTEDEDWDMTAEESPGKSMIAEEPSVISPILRKGAIMFFLRCS